MAQSDSDHADRSLDNFHERVVRNEGDLHSLRELVRETREADRQLIEQRSDSLEQALRLQAREYERRLKNLNGEAKRIADIQAQSVTRELFDSELRSVRAEISNLRGNIHTEVEAARAINGQKISILESEVDALKLTSSAQTGKSLGRGELIALVVSVTVVLGFIVTFANYVSTR